jgi:hypothetical protein
LFPGRVFIVALSLRNRLRNPTPGRWLWLSHGPSHERPVRLGCGELGAEASSFESRTWRQDVAAADGERAAGVTVLASPRARADLAAGLHLEPRRPQSVKAPRSEAVVDSSSGNTRVCASVYASIVEARATTRHLRERKRAARESGLTPPSAPCPLRGDERTCGH